MPVFQEQKIKLVYAALIIALTVSCSSKVSVSTASKDTKSKSGTTNDPNANSNLKVDITSSVSGPTSVVPMPITITFSDNVEGFILENIIVTNGKASNLVGSGKIFTVDITPTSDGPVSVRIASGIVKNQENEKNSASALFNMIYDSSLPKPTPSPAAEKLPVHTATSVAFTDTDTDAGEVSGSVIITKASNESDITHYVLYWGSSSTTKQSSLPIATVAATGSNLTQSISANTTIPSSPAATHILVYSKNAIGEMETGVSVAIADLIAPSHAATSVAFTDTDSDRGQVAGTVTITKASSESDVTHYVLYWGSDATTKQNATPIATIAVTGSNVTSTIAANTTIPSSPTATHLLVYTKNADGEMATGVSVAITDVAIPTHAAASVAFTDTDVNSGKIGGTVTITKATTETDVTHYVLYWGSDATTKQSGTAIDTIAVTGSNVTSTLAANTSIPAAPAATHLLVYTKNADGEMATGVSVAITDVAIPIHTATSVAFTDTDTTWGKLGGTVTITKSSNETDVTDYVLYWGSSSTVKQNATPIATITATGSNVTSTIAANTSIPTSPTATHLLVFTKNANGEMATGVSVAITDIAVPIHTAASVSFTDTDGASGKVGGSVSIAKATSEADVTHYVLYWGSNSTTKQSGTAITTIAVTGADVSYTIAANTSIPTSPTATHLLVFTKNANGEMATGVSVAITDIVVPTNAAAGVAFTDTDTASGKIGGTVTITKAASEADVTHYVLYWGSSSTIKQSATAIATIAVTGSNVTSTISANTSIPTSPTATHLLVFTKNADGEMATGVSVAITDVAIPTHAAASVAFTDTDTDAGQVAGTVTITKASSESDVTHYVLYWGSDATTKQNATPIATIAVTGSNVTSTIATDTSIPSSPTATHLLVFTKNANGEMATGVYVAITDNDGSVQESWSSTTTTGAPAIRNSGSAVWTGAKMIVWGGYDTVALNTGGIYDPVANSWTATTTTSAPSPRKDHVGLWTGSKMLIWGGNDTSSSFNSGGLYDPTANSWTATTTTAAPSAKSSPANVWTGAKMIVWGGLDSSNAPDGTGGVYDPVANSWTTVTATNAPSARSALTSVWTGSKMIVWGGYDGSAHLNDGGLYDPVANSWTAPTTTSAPAIRSRHTAVWTGSKMIVWGGYNGTTSYNSGGAYNPAADSWTATSTTSVPAIRYNQQVIWTGSTMMVWGGTDGTNILNDGGIYNPTANSWTSITTSSAPATRNMHSSVWTGSKLIVWGGTTDGTTNVNTGSIYTPASASGWNTWTAMTSSGAPSARYGHAAVWTGSKMFIWGSSLSDNTGGLYDPVANSWSATSTTGALSGRNGAYAVWTGSKIIVGGGGGGLSNDGGIYDPVANSWSTMTTTNAPTERVYPRAVWTGSKLIVWGGGYYYPTDWNSGGIYDPVADSWTATTVVNAPGPRKDFTALWTGSKMLVWGGYYSASSPNLYNDGGIYDPVANTWTAITTTGAPTIRDQHHAAWTGSKMLIWGGREYPNAYVNTGGVYDLAANSWTTMSTTNAPSNRIYAASVWTGSKLLVWGGYTGSVNLNTGGLYDPAANTWNSTTQTNVPAILRMHSGVWTGSSMIIFGGYTSGYTNAGAIYTP